MIYVEKLRSELEKHKGVRIGETAVVSRKVHTMMPDRPEEIHIIMNSDAGRVFYNRFYENEIIHIDLFHEISALDVKKVAEYLKENILESVWGGYVDNIDIQTGSGGGRLSGSLSFGTSESLKKDHMNHMHLAGLIPDDNLNIVFFLVEKAEEVLQQQNVELRKVEKIINEMGNSPMDMSHYSTDSDSHLKQNRPDPSGGRIRQEAASLVERFDSIKEIEDVLCSFSKDKAPGEDLSGLKRKYGDMDDIVKHLEKKHFVRKESNSYFLTESGEKLKDYFRINRKELELILKRSIKSLPKLKNYQGFDIAYSKNKTGMDNKGPLLRENIDPVDWIGELEINETIKNALTRCYYKEEAFGIEGQDLVILKRSPKINQDICLIIDASASMAGHRLRNAKFLAKHLILNSHRRISVLAFQEREVKLFVPFTRNFGNLDAGLNDIISTGLTPLALAIERGLSYMSSKLVKNPLIILITDGIPTVSLWTADPIKDAIDAASKVGRKKIDFCCIGLQPNKDCLINIAKAAKGKLFIVDELNRDVLLDVARKSGQLL